MSRPADSSRGRVDPRGEEIARRNRALVGKLGVIVVAMFGFGYALVPLYEKICEVTGLRDIDRADRLDAARLERWSATIASIARRLDGLDGRPLDEDQYLVAFGRVWLRRDLLWLCFGAWALLAVTAWRRHRGGSGRPPVAEFAFRALFLVSTLATPIFTATLLLPAAVLHLAPVQGAAARRLDPRRR